MDLPRLDTTKGTWVLVEGVEQGGFRLTVKHDGQKYEYPIIDEIEEVMANAMTAGELLGLPDDHVLYSVKGIYDNAGRSLMARKAKQFLQQHGVAPEEA